MAGLTQVLNELRVLFPNDGAKTTRFFAAAIIAEQQGDNEKAAAYLGKAIAAEARGE